MATGFPFSLQNWHRATTYILKVFSRFILLRADFLLRCISAPSISKCRDLHYLGDRCALDFIEVSDKSQIWKKLTAIGHKNGQFHFDIRYIAYLNKALARANESFDECEYRLSQVRVNTANRRESSVATVITVSSLSIILFKLSVVVLKFFSVKTHELKLIFKYLI